MLLDMNMARMAKGELPHAAKEEFQHLIKNPPSKVREETKRGVAFPGHELVKAAIGRHPAMVQEYRTDGCLPCKHGTGHNPQTSWSCKGTDAP